MKSDEIRLECLKMVYRHDRSPEQNILLAAKFEELVKQVSDELKNELPKKDVQQKTGKLNPLS